MAAIQQISARIGRVTGRGIAGNMKGYPAGLVYGLIGLLLAANTINIGADIAAMGAAAKLIIGGPALLYSAIFAVASVLLEIFISYKRYAPILKWLTLALFAYVGTVFSVHVPWGEALRSTVVPKLALNAKSLTALIAVLGTTISPYLFFWQASQEVEEEMSRPQSKPLKRAPKQAWIHFRRIEIDTNIGMFFSNLIAFFIILTCAVTLHAQGKHEIDTAAQAAEALRPVAGKFAFLLFSLGIVGTGLLAVPVLAGSAAYPVSEVLHWRIGLDRTLSQAKGFYGVIAAATLLGLALDFTSINPIKALFWTAVINGVVAVPVMVMMMFMASNSKIMSEKFTLKPGLKIMGWLATAVMITAVIGVIATWGKS
jgi:Mn2+/Fe2+ NRAMP family transporter